MLEMVVSFYLMNEYCTKKSTVGHVTQKYVAFPLISAIPSPQISVSPFLRLRTAVPDHEQSLPSARHCNPSPTAVPPSGGGLQSQSLHQALDWTTITVPDWDCVCLGPLAPRCTVHLGASGLLGTLVVL